MIVLAIAGAVADPVLHRHRSPARARAFSALGAMLLGVIVTGLFVAISMTRVVALGTTPRNTSRTGITAAKTDAEAAVTGDTVGDPIRIRPVQQ
jgi:Na+/H+-translocating membrane pyrophosphatase